MNSRIAFERMDDESMDETIRIILGLRAAGWDSKEINDFIIWIATGDEQYSPKKRKAAEQA